VVPDVSPSVVPRPTLDYPTLDEVSPVATVTDVTLDARPEVSDVSNFSVRRFPAIDPNGMPVADMHDLRWEPGSSLIIRLLAISGTRLIRGESMPRGGRRREPPAAASLQRWDSLVKMDLQNGKVRE
jgi:hypothetical protein